VVANNITARTRLSMWQISRTLQGLQSITDGCMYQPMNILAFRKNERKKPSLESLSELDKLKRHRSIQQTTLGGLQWRDLFEGKKKAQEYPNMDQLVNEHIKTFWAKYNLQIPYQLEHKIEKISTKVFYIKKAHHVAKTVDDGPLQIKIRGLAMNNVISEKPAIVNIAKTLIEKPESYQKIETLEHIEERTARVSDYIKTKDKDNIVYPGDTITKIVTYRNLGDNSPVKNVEEYEKRKNEQNQLDNTKFILKAKNQEELKKALLPKKNIYLPCPAPPKL
jgi:hypothetical protein